MPADTDTPAKAGSGWLPIVEPDRDFLGSLLREQQSLTAVEQFSREHEAGTVHSTGVPAQEPYYRRLMPVTAPGPDQQYSFEVDLDACSGCKACVVACHTLNGLEEHETWRRVGTLVGEDSVQHVTTACHHCEDPGCLKGCPVKAYVKDEATGIVRHLDDQCIGCKYCTMMCPYEVPQYSERLGIVRKCDMCHQRLSVGEAPACVQACPNEAIRIRLVGRTSCTDSPTSEGPAISTAGVARLVPGAPDSAITRPTTLYHSRRPGLIDRSIPQDATIDPVAESHWPLAVMLVMTQAAIGLLIVGCVGAVGLLMFGASMPETVTRLTATAALAMAAIGLNLAPLHLGQPLKAWRIFLGLKTSWLSREAVVLGIFAAMLGTATLLLWLPLAVDYLPMSVRHWNHAEAGQYLLAASLPVGLLGFYSSAMIYIATKRRLWRFRRTMTRFCGTAVCMGLVGHALVMEIAGIAAGAVIGAALLGMAATLAKIGYETATHYAPGLGQIGSAGRAESGETDEAVRAARLARGPLRHWLAARRAAAVLFLLCLSAAVLSSAEPRTPEDFGWTPALALSLALLFGIAGELAERLLYFATVVHDRMPGTLR